MAVTLKLCLLGIALGQILLLLALLRLLEDPRVLVELVRLLLFAFRPLFLPTLIFGVVIAPLIFGIIRPGIPVALVILASLVIAYGTF